MYVEINLISDSDSDDIISDNEVNHDADNLFDRHIIKEEKIDATQTIPFNFSGKTQLSAH